ncbi:MAG: (Fe-S)-binding protein [Bacteroidota bacterium]|nr:(Fe-S)-binding protein [Bacteroidota bacterium]MDP4217086.1 (Fe-S)-binding protein [Bacteroidota bacterium]MDP4246055.1 (Fe-S)-binding protein [Bacteroidota bacterium]MDP4255960.1 (Fe-S)-binding protein [Bacteroidota bacterium]MDP4258818.1 (Fe-S)-binding protein [Bacteroidota bacterium]
MGMLSQVLFILAAGVAAFAFGRQVMRIRRNILLGRDEDFSDRRGERWKNLLLLAFGQKKMFRNPLVALMHFVIYAGFIIINLEVLEIALDGLFGTHRLFAAPLGPLYPALINAFEFLAVGVLLACVLFLSRRNILKLRRFISHDLDGWPRSDANYILLTEILLMGLFLTMNAADTLLQARGYGHYGSRLTGDFAASQWIHPLLNGLSSPALAVLERTCWWLHILGILAFLNYLPYSKHLHILLAFPNAYYARLEPEGKLRNMPEVQKEVLYAMQPEMAPPTGAVGAPPPKFGAKDVFDLSWRNLLDAYACTECGRCTAACPANITGKVLSPRKIMMSTRDRLEEVGRNIDTNGAYKDDGKSLLSYITTEELRACTTCNACVEECPVSISPLEIIMEMRRALIMEDSNAPQEWNALFGNVENNFAPWKFSPDDRDRWTAEG